MKVGKHGKLPWCLSQHGIPKVIFGTFWIWSVAMFLVILCYLAEICWDPQDHAKTPMRIQDSNDSICATKAGRCVAWRSLHFCQSLLSRLQHGPKGTHPSQWIEWLWHALGDGFFVQALLTGLCMRLLWRISGRCQLCYLESHIFWCQKLGEVEGMKNVSGLSEFVRNPSFWMEFVYFMFNEFNEFKDPFWVASKVKILLRRISTPSVCWMKMCHGRIFGIWEFEMNP